MPQVAEIIHVGLDPRGMPCVWALVDTNYSLTPTTIYVVGTGNPAPNDVSRHLGSFVQTPFVWHVFTN